MEHETNWSGSIPIEQGGKLNRAQCDPTTLLEALTLHGDKLAAAVNMLQAVLDRIQGPQAECNPEPPNSPTPCLSSEMCRVADHATHINILAERIRSML